MGHAVSEKSENGTTPVKRFIRWYEKGPGGSIWHLRAFTPQGAPVWDALDDAADYKDDESARVALKACRNYHGRDHGDIVLVRVTRMRRPRTSGGETPLTEEERKAFAMHQAVALVHGFNEMAARSTTLGEKTYYRMARDAAEKHFNALGGKIDRIDERQAILTIPGHVPEIRFDDRDVELMRACVARYDARSAAAKEGGDGT